MAAAHSASTVMKPASTFLRVTGAYSSKSA
jgi:hypothetical protein